jgi:HEAT repeat protein
MISVPDLERLAIWAVWTGVLVVGLIAVCVVVQRLAIAAGTSREKHLSRQYGPVIDRALAGEAAAIDSLVRSPRRYRVALARLLLFPLVEDRNPERIAATRAIVLAMSIVPLGDRWLGSRLWWRRSVAVQAFGLFQFRDRTPAIVAALDDAHPAVRNAALDALADLHDPSTLRAIVVRLHDESLERGRRAAALAAFGSECEGFLLDLSRVDPAHRRNYALALGICGTERSRPILSEWTTDSRPPVRAAALGALAHVGLDAQGAAAAITALDNDDVTVRMMAAGALRNSTVSGDAATHLARHLDDVWPVAVRAARTLQSMGGAGWLALKAQSTRTDLAGVLAQQMLWELEARP